MVFDRREVPVIDLLIAAATDPLGSIMVALLTFSLCLYPVGLMLGAPCSTCCPSCDLCPDLPETLTATYSNFPDQARGPDLVAIDFSSCSGYGARAKLVAPNSLEENAGPMAAIEIESSGFGYAVIGRVEPTVELEAGSGTPATINITLEETVDAAQQCLPVWAMKTAEVTDGGTGYTNGQFVDVLPASGSLSSNVGRLRVSTVIAEPVLNATAEPGDGATFSVTMKEVDFGFPPEKRYAIDTIAVGGSGTGYVDGTVLEITPADDTTTVDGLASAVLKNQRVEPSPQLTFSLFSQGGGAVLNPVLQQATDSFGDAVWEIIEVDVADGGSGYQPFEQILIAPDDSIRQSQFSFFLAVANVLNEEPDLEAVVLADGGTGAEVEFSLEQITLLDGSLAWRIAAVSIVNAGSGYAEGGSIGVTINTGQEIEPLETTITLNAEGGLESIQIGAEEGSRGYFAIVGVIQSVTIYGSGQFYGDSGIPESVTVEAGGFYYNDTGVIESVEIIPGNEGEYYKEDDSIEPIVPPIGVFISQGNGSGAVLEPVVDTNVTSDTFGQITGVTIVNGGDDYIAWLLQNSLCCGQWLNGKSVVLRRVESPLGCLYQHVWCGSAPFFRGMGFSRLYFYNSGTVTIIGNRCVPSVSDNIELVFDWDINCFSDAIKTLPDDPAAPRITVTLDGQYDPYYLNPTGASNLSTTESGVVDPALSGCHSCCRSEGITPQEITVIVQNLQNGGSIESGTYVLQRNYFPIFFGQSNDSAFWAIGGSGSIVVRLKRCSYGDGEEAWQDNGCGDTCWQQCYTSATISDFLSTAYFPRPNVGECGECAATPQCRPGSGPYLLEAPQGFVGPDGQDVWLNYYIVTIQ